MVVLPDDARKQLLDERENAEMWEVTRNVDQRVTIGAGTGLEVLPQLGFLFGGPIPCLSERKREFSAPNTIDVCKLLDPTLARAIYHIRINSFHSVPFMRSNRKPGFSPAMLKVGAISRDEGIKGVIQTSNNVKGWQGLKVPSLQYFILSFLRCWIFKYRF